MIVHVHPPNIVNELTILSIFEKYVNQYEKIK